MQIPTLSHAEYAALGGDESEELLWFQAIDPSRLLEDEWETPVRRGLRLQYLNVTQPYRYPTHGGNVLLILSESDPTTYDMLDAIWPAPVSAFAYIIRDNLYDELEETSFYFRDGADVEDGNRSLPPFALEDWRTH